MRNLDAVSWDESTILIFCALEWSPTKFVLQCDQWFHDGLNFFFHYLLLLEWTFEWALYPSPCSSLFTLHLDWSLNTSNDKKIKCSLYICELVIRFSVSFKDLLKKNNSVCIHHRNIQSLAAELFKVKEKPSQYNNEWCFSYQSFKLWFKITDFFRNTVNSKKIWIKLIKIFYIKSRSMIPIEIKSRLLKCLKVK